MIYQNICKSAHIKQSMDNIDVKGVEEKMISLLGPKQISCKLILNKDGDISEVSVTTSSGSLNADETALKMIRSAAPFGKANPTESFPYEVIFPSLKVQPLLMK